MNETVLVHAHVDETTKVGDIGDGAFQRHARHQVTYFFHAVTQLCRLEFRTRIAARLLQFPQNVLYGWQPELGGDIVLRVQRADEGDVADHGFQIALVALRDGFHDTVGLRVNRRGIQRVLTLVHTQKARRLLEGLVAETWHLLEIIATAEAPVGIAKLNDVVDQGLIQP